jgi:hypothetical protein
LDEQPRPETAAAPTDCLACGVEFVGDWCHACGEQRVTTRLRLGDFLREWVSATLGLERGYLRTCVGMLRRPGRTVHEYLDGMRRTHCSPLRFMLWTMVGVILAMAALDWLLPPDFTDPLMGMAPRGLSEFVAKSQQGSTFSMDEAQRAEHYALSMRGMQLNALLIPAFFALGSMLIFRRPRRTYAEHLVLSLYLFAMLAPSMVIWWALARIGPWWDWIAVMPLCWLYATWVAKQFHRTSWANALGGTLGAYLIATVCAMPFLMIYNVVVMMG